MEELGLFFLIGGPVIGLVIMLVGIIQLFSNNDKAIKGRNTVLVGFILIVMALLIGLSVCSGGF